MKHPKRRSLLQAGAALCLSYSGIVAGAQSDSRRRIGVLGMTTAAGMAERWAAFRQSLQTLGWVDGRQVEFVERYADGDLARLPTLANEIVAARVDVLVTHGIPGTKAARQATQTIPIVMATVADPVAAGLVQSYARPGVNVTGTAFLAHEMAAKRVQLLTEALPGAKRVAVLSNSRNPIFSQAMYDSMLGAAQQFALQLQRFDAPDSAQYAAVFSEIAAQKPDALLITEEASFNANVGLLAELALGHRLPSVGTKDYCTSGGLVGYGADFNAMFERAGHVVDRLLRGARAAELPIEQPSRFELAANLRTARALGVELPRALQMRVDTLIR